MCVCYSNSSLVATTRRECLGLFVCVIFDACGIFEAAFDMSLWCVLFCVFAVRVQVPPSKTAIGNEFQRNHLLLKSIERGASSTVT